MTLEKLFRSHRADPTPKTLTELCTCARGIVAHDPDITWMDDPRTVLIIHHVLRLEMIDSIRGDWTWSSLNQTSPFTRGDKKDNLITPFIQDAWQMPAKDTLGLSERDMHIFQIGVHITPHQPDVVRDAIPAIERFLERERALFGKYVSAIFDMMEAPNIVTRSERPGHWTYMMEGDTIESEESTFENIAQWALNQAERITPWT